MGLATRIIPVLLFDEYGCVKGQRFQSRRIGSIHDRLRLIERRDVDELILLDISATPNKRGPRFEEIRGLCENLFCPVTVGGGIRNESDIRRLLADGADKCAIGTRALDEPAFIDRSARRFGAQAIVAAIDAAGPAGRTVADCGRRDTGRDCVEWAREVADRGAGEILLTSIDRDGTQTGYDLDLISAVSQAVSIPVVAAGGCGSYEDMAAALRAGAHAVASGAFFQFCEATPKGASRYLKEHGFVTRI